MGALLCVSTFVRACLRGPIRTLAEAYLLGSNVTRAHVLALLTACARVHEMWLPVRHDVDFFLHCELHHDIHMRGSV